MLTVGQEAVFLLPEVLPVSAAQLAVSAAAWADAAAPAVKVKLNLIPAKVVQAVSAASLPAIGAVAAFPAAAAGVPAQAAARSRPQVHQ